MINFEYLAIWSDNSKQTWVIEANDELEAKDNLHKLWLSVLKLVPTEKKADFDLNQKQKEIEDKTKPEYEKILETWEKILSYEFSWYDSTWVKQKWTIESSNAIIAYKRLVEEFSIDVEWIVLASLSDTEKVNKKQTSVDEIINQAYEQWIEVKHKKVTTTNELDIDVALTNEEHEQIKFEVEKYIKIIWNLIEKNPDILTWIEKAEINKRSFELEKIKRSTNTFYIQNELNSIIEEIIKKFKPFSEKLDEESIWYLQELDSYIWYETKSFIYEKALHLIDKYNFFKEFIKKVENKLSSAISPEIRMQKQKINKYFSQAFYHFRSIFRTKWEDRKKHAQTLLKSWKLIINSYKTYYKLRKRLEEQKNKYSIHLTKLYTYTYREIREFTWWILAIYIIYYALLNLAVTKWILLPIKPAINTISSPFINSFILAILLLNLALLIKVKYFTRSMSFNVLSSTFILFLTYTYYNNF